MFLFKIKYSLINFKNMTMDSLPRGIMSQAESPIFYTPLIQLKTPSK